MVEVNTIKSIYPSWRVNPTPDQQDKKKDQKDSQQDYQKDKYRDRK